MVNITQVNCYITFFYFLINKYFQLFSLGITVYNYYNLCLRLPLLYSNCITECYLVFCQFPTLFKCSSLKYPPPPLLMKFSNSIKLCYKNVNRNFCSVQQKMENLPQVIPPPSPLLTFLRENYSSAIL